MSSTTTTAQAAAAQTEKNTNEITTKLEATKLEDPASYLKFPNFAPQREGENKFTPTEPFEHRDRGHDADPQLRNLFPEGLKNTKNITPKFGTEVRGVQLSELSDAAKNDLALFVAQRGVVVFRDQNLRELPVEKSLEFGRYFGPQHVHPTYPSPKGFPDIHVVYTDKAREPPASLVKIASTRTTSTVWHSDISYELQPAGTTFLVNLQSPEAGGDTGFADTVEAYNRLSPEFRKRIEGLEAFHSGVAQVNFAKENGGIVKKSPVGSYHPIVRTHPVTGQKALFVNKVFTTHIKNLKLEESEYLLNFLYDHIAKSADIQLRARWEDGTIVAWDNRRTSHTPILDFQDSYDIRHLYRITPLAERPFFDPKVAPAGEQKAIEQVK